MKALLRLKTIGLGELQTILEEDPRKSRHPPLDLIIDGTQIEAPSMKPNASAIPSWRLKIFLCHSSNDKPAVRKLYKSLVEDGFSPWLDEEDILGGQVWDAEIRKAVRSADVVIVCLSDGSVTKAGYVQKEIRFALDIAEEQPEGSIYMVPVKLEDCGVPDSLSKWQWVSLFEEAGYKRLLRALRARAGS